MMTLFLVSLVVLKVITGVLVYRVVFAGPIKVEG